MVSSVSSFTGTLLLLSFLPVIYGGYKIGVGIADCTGPAADIVFMGYARSTQKGCGILLRQFARAFVLDDGHKRAVFVSADAAMIGHGIRQEVLSHLNKTYGGIYNINNVIVSGTHTHSTPGGFLKDLMYDIPSSGFVRQTFNALTDGIVKAIIKAHENMVEGRIHVNSGELLDANINRSPTAYLLNPKAERDKYAYDVDKEMVQLKFTRSSDDTLIGAINWFAVHPTSLNYTNCLISSDNVGYASVLLEKLINNNARPGQGSFVGAFASTNLGDVSPNIKGPRCVDTGQTCDLDSSTCDGNAQLCIASGPGKDMFESNKIISGRLFGKAVELLKASDSAEVEGPVNFVHQFVDMPKQTATVKFPNGTTQEVKGCRPAMGYSFAAGTTDGPGVFDFSQATTSSNVFWNLIRDFIFPPSDEDVECQHPKPILINTGGISAPYEWQPRVVAIQLLQIGEVILIAVPGEFTTMAGRRLRDAVKKVALTVGRLTKPTAIIAGLSNVYTSYITTPEEYQKQRYEGASTIFGPHTATIYMERYVSLAEALFTNEPVDPGPDPYVFPKKLIALAPGYLFDTAGWNRNYGDCLKQPPKRVGRGKTVEAVFVSGNPRNNLMHDATFLSVEKLNGNNNWTVIATDADWETKFIWQKINFLGSSQATIEWETSNNVSPGMYKIRHFGYYKYFFGGKYFYEGQTQTFEVV